ncbi:hypothetical protein pipiens_013455 [Culex pipiens pipiens]|uniref:Uncharacterized protein n=1 Tax=Culex pipiens pipiens TaxID=38569 RepID=A0ABD1CYE2_CULPP
MSFLLDVTGTFEGHGVTPIEDPVELPSDDPLPMFPDPVELPPDVTGTFGGVTPIEDPAELSPDVTGTFGGLGVTPIEDPVELPSDDPPPVLPDPVELPPDVTGTFGGQGVVSDEDPAPIRFQVVISRRTGTGLTDVSSSGLTKRYFLRCTREIPFLQSPFQIPGFQFQVDQSSLLPIPCQFRVGQSDQRYFPMVLTQADRRYFRMIHCQVDCRYFQKFPYQADRRYFQMDHYPLSCQAGEYLLI